MVLPKRCCGRRRGRWRPPCGPALPTFAPATAPSGHKSSLGGGLGDYHAVEDIRQRCADAKAVCRRVLQACGCAQLSSLRSMPSGPIAAVDVKRRRGSPTGGSGTAPGRPHLRVGASHLPGLCPPCARPRGRSSLLPMLCQVPPASSTRLHFAGTSSSLLACAVVRRPSSTKAYPLV
jgi:hypothetical protein